MANASKKVRILSGGGFEEQEVNAGTVGALRTELDIASGASVSVDGVVRTDDFELSDGQIIAAVQNNKTGGLESVVYYVIG
ncbi:MAG: hypothetical protein GOVbin4296_19 [Prokaryotic dsDNA virus sp.]|nr:MAG: hypothetical protein GOVbin4296_19 [Prokaryotic dsDNA virus sp.]|tara:strand:+ start:481 stop:723 length:243 start_codon:yes stop_codon:yes gene_type:complete